MKQSRLMVMVFKCFQMLEFDVPILLQDDPKWLQTNTSNQSSGNSRTAPLISVSCLDVRCDASNLFPLKTYQRPRT